MADLIERSALLKTLKRPEAWEVGRLEQWDIDITTVEMAPAVDAVPVVHGRWVHQPEIGWGETWLCSKCGERIASTVMGKPRYKYCPMCGAKMDGGGND